MLKRMTGLPRNWVEGPFDYSARFIVSFGALNKANIAFVASREQITASACPAAIL